MLNSNVVVASNQDIKSSVDSFKDFLTLLNNNTIKEDSSEQETKSVLYGVKALQSLEQVEKEFVNKPAGLFIDDLRSSFLNVCDSVEGVKSLQAKHIRAVLRHIDTLDYMLDVNEQKDSTLKCMDTVVSAVQDFNESVVYLLINQKFNLGGIGSKLKDWFIHRPVEFVSEHRTFAAVSSSLVLSAIGGAVWYNLRDNKEVAKDKKDKVSSGFGGSKAGKSEAKETTVNTNVPEEEKDNEPTVTPDDSSHQSSEEEIKDSDPKDPEVQKEKPSRRFRRPRGAQKKGSYK